jgi:hypothetical protein
VHLAGGGDARRGELRHVAVDQVLRVAPGFGGVGGSLGLMDRHPMEDHHLVLGLGRDLGYRLHRMVGVPGAVYADQDRSKHRLPLSSSPDADGGRPACTR